MEHDPITENDGVPGGESGDRRDEAPPAAQNREGFFEQMWRNLRLIAERSSQTGVVVAFFAVTVLYWGGFFLAVGGGATAVFLGAYGVESGADLLTNFSIGVGLAIGLATFVGIVAYQTLLIGLKGPMHALLFEGPEAVSGIKDTLRQSISRFWSVLGVGVVIGLVVYGGGLFALGIAAAAAVGGEIETAGAALTYIALPGSLWVVAAAAVSFVWAPATYFAATREIGIVDALSTSYRFVVDHIGELIWSWIVAIAAFTGLAFVLLVLNAVPMVGQLLALPLQILMPLAGLVYWTAVYATLEAADDPALQVQTEPSSW